MLFFRVRLDRSIGVYTDVSARGVRTPILRRECTPGWLCKKLVQMQQDAFQLALATRLRRSVGLQRSGRPHRVTNSDYYESKVTNDLSPNGT